MNDTPHQQNPGLQLSIADYGQLHMCRNPLVAVYRTLRVRCSLLMAASRNILVRLLEYVQHSNMFIIIMFALWNSRGYVSVKLKQINVRNGSKSISECIIAYREDDTRVWNMLCKPNGFSTQFRQRSISAINGPQFTFHL